MGLIGTIFYVVGVLAIIEGLFVLVFPNSIKRILLWVKKGRNLRKAAIIELIIGIVLVVIAGSI